MLLWNWLAVSLLGVKALSFWISVGIVVALKLIGRLFFKSNISVNKKED